MKAIIFGGAFNPPTLAHHQILEACAIYAKEIGAEVWLLPSGDRRDKTITVSRGTRMSYLKAMFADVETPDVVLKVDTTELDRPVMVETYDTIIEFQERFPEYEFTWVFGADSTETMEAWKQGEWLLENLNILAISRAGNKVNPKAKHATVLPLATVETSSTELRQKLELNEEFSHLVTKTVFETLSQKINR